MKFICTQSNLKKAIFYTERIVSRQTTLPILNNILINAGKGGVKLSATNLEMGVDTKIGAKVEKEGKITVPVRLLSSFINNLPAGENTQLELINQSLKIKSGSVKAVIKGVSADDFPLIPKKSEEYQIILKNSQLKEIIDKILVSVAINEARPELTGINFILNEEEIILASTDSFRLTEIKIKLEKGNIQKEAYRSLKNKKSNVIIPATTITELNRIITSQEDGEVKITIEESQIFFEINGTTIVSRLINGKYPEYQHILPQQFKSRAVGSRDLILGSVKMASIFASGKTNEIIFKISSDAPKMIIEAKSAEVGENTSELKLDITGPAQEVVLNSRYILDGLNVINTSSVAILMNNEATPIALKEINEKNGEVLNNYIYIVMPIKN